MFASLLYLFRNAVFVLILFLPCQVIQQPKEVIVKQSLTSAQTGLPAQNQTQTKQMLIQTSAHPAGISYSFTIQKFKVSTMFFK